MSILRTVSRGSPNTRPASRALIPSAKQALRTRRYVSTLYIQSTFNQVLSLLIEGDRRYSLQTPPLSARPASVGHYLSAVYRMSRTSRVGSSPRRQGTRCALLRTGGSARYQPAAPGIPSQRGRSAQQGQTDTFRRGCRLTPIDTNGVCSVASLGVSCETLPDRTSRHAAL